MFFILMMATGTCQPKHQLLILTVNLFVYVDYSQHQVKMFKLLFLLFIIKLYARSNVFSKYVLQRILQRKSKIVIFQLWQDIKKMVKDETCLLL